MLVVFDLPGGGRFEVDAESTAACRAVLVESFRRESRQEPARVGLLGLWADLLVRFDNGDYAVAASTGRMMR